ncbi:MAG: Omp28-related outer membrane protein [Flavobacteriales bacterium]|nr:Omp28-related outer membrane protein [Flavobacteriales bacterium]
MKKLILLSALFGTMLFGCKEDNGTDTTPTQEEFLASTEKQNRNVVLEDMTGVRCGYCPDGHQRAADLLAANPGRVSVVAVHTGSYADPQAGWGNYTNSYGNDIRAQTKLTGYPAGTVNRQYFASYNQGGGTAMSRGQWATAAAEIMAEASPVNLGAKATYNSTTKELAVKIDMYYTGDQSANENRLNVALCQNNMKTTHADYSLPSPYIHNDYVMNHTMRDYLTGPWGELVPSEKTTEGSKYSVTYKYDVPGDYNGATVPPGGGEVVPADLEVTIFVAKGQQNIITGITVPVTVQ